MVQRERVLITGITGMAGSHLADFVRRVYPEDEVVGMIRWRSPTKNIRHLRGVQYVYGDLTDMASLWSVFGGEKFDKVFHLAAQSYVDYSQVAPGATMDANATGTVNLLSAILASDTWPSVMVCSSSEVYGNVAKWDLPITESQPLRPASPYAVSKVAADMAGLQYFLSHDLHVVRTRAFTNTGPRRGPVFVASSFALQIAKIEAGLADGPVLVGNLDSVRTWCDVRDMVRAYWMALEWGQAGEVYNIGGDWTSTIGQMLEILKGLSTTEGIEHVVDPARLRKSDVTQQVPSTEKFETMLREAGLGWEKEYTLEETLRDLLDYWRAELAR